MQVKVSQLGKDLFLSNFLFQVARLLQGQIYKELLDRQKIIFVYFE